MANAHSSTPTALASLPRSKSGLVRLGDALPAMLEEIRQNGRPTYYCNLVQRTHYLYRIYADKTLLYVGVSVDPEARMSKHRLRPWWRTATAIRIERRSSRADALAAEREAILAENPLHNVARPKGAL